MFASICQPTSLSGRIVDPTSSLPPEILCHIFEEYVQAQLPPFDAEFTWFALDAGSPHFFNATKPKVPLLLGSICRSWRQAAWAHPRLWSTLAIRLNPGFSGFVRSYPVAYTYGPELVAQWLGRAGKLPLRIRLQDTPETLKRPHRSSYNYDAVMKAREASKAVIRALNSYSAQWHSLELHAIPFDVLNELGSGTDDEDDSILENISFSGNNDVQRSPTLLLERFPRQHRPTHLSFVEGFCPSDFNINWTKVTHLYAEDMLAFRSPQKVIQLVVTSPITHLVLSQIEAFECPNFELKHLTNLSIVSSGEADADVIDPILNALTLPSLKHLEFREGETEYDDDYNFPFPADALINLIKRSSCFVEVFVFLDHALKDEDLIRILQSMPSITDLTITLRIRNDSTPLFEHLSQASMRTASAPFLPLLETLKITARAPKLWSALTGVFVDDPSLDWCSAQGFCEYTPIRSSLRILFHLYQEPQDVPYIGRQDILMLLNLFNDLRCLINVDDDYDRTWVENQHIFNLSRARVFSEEKPEERSVCTVRRDKEYNGNSPSPLGFFPEWGRYKATVQVNKTGF